MCGYIYVYILRIYMEKHVALFTNLVYKAFYTKYMTLEYVCYFAECVLVNVAANPTELNVMEKI